GLLRVVGDVGNAPAHDGGADGARLERAKLYGVEERAGRELRRRSLRCGGRCGGGFRRPAPSLGAFGSVWGGLLLRSSDVAEDESECECGNERKNRSADHGVFSRM